MDEKPPPAPIAVIPVLSYAGSRNDRTGNIVWREGSVVVARQNAVFPPRCVRCNAPADSEPKGRAYYWHYWSLYLLLLVFGFGYVIGGALARKRGVVYVSLCGEHRRRRRRGILLGWGFVIAGIAVMAAVIFATSRMTHDSNWTAPLFLCGFAISAAATIISFCGCRILYAKRIDDKFLWLGGAGRTFVESLPESQGL